jgi:YidC/Oxa1 family membrane protein insertase
VDPGSRCDASRAATRWRVPDSIRCRRLPAETCKITMEKRVFLAIALMFVVLALYDHFLVPKLVPPAPVQTPAGAPAPATAAPSAAPPAAPAPEPKAPAARALVADTQAHDIVVDTDRVRAVFSSEGGTLRSWKIKNHHDFEIVPVDMPPQLPYPFTLATDDPALSATLAKALFQPSTTSLSLGSGPGTLSFEYRDASGLSARKTFQFQPEGKSYLVEVTASIDVNGASRPAIVQFGPALGLGFAPDGSRHVDAQALLFRNDKAERLAASALEKAPTHDGTFEFAGVEEQYFLSVALPGSQPVKMEFRPFAQPTAKDPKVFRKFISYSVAVPGQANLPFFIGPKDFDELRKVDKNLVYAIDFGFFRVLVVPLLQSLKAINRYAGNWGWSIIILTIVINILIFPLRHRSMVSMRKMQTAQPEIKAIQDRYSKYKLTDPERQKMNPELMALYKSKGINPASGCVPMLLTFPILLAFYSMLSVAIELRGAPFMWWIHDLSLRDPWFVTPLLMGGTMFWQQKMMPAPSTDPLQARILLFMPVIFTVSFLWAPAGMVLYWLVSNLMGILQQTVTLKMIGAPPRPPAPPQKGRAPKSVGSGSTIKT